MMEIHCSNKELRFITNGPVGTRKVDGVEQVANGTIDVLVKNFKVEVTDAIGAFLVSQYPNRFSAKVFKKAQQINTEYSPIGTPATTSEEPAAVPDPEPDKDSGQE